MKNIRTIHKFIASTAVIVASILTAHSILAAERYSVQGMVLKVDRSQKSFLVSHDSIPGFMQAMTMLFDVRDVKELNGLTPGAMVEFMLVVDRNSAYAERLRLRPYVTAEQDPLTARRLKLVKELDATHSARQLKISQAVPDFVLTDQCTPLREPFAIPRQGDRDKLYLHELRSCRSSATEPPTILPPSSGGSKNRWDAISCC